MSDDRGVVRLGSGSTLTHVYMSDTVFATDGTAGFHGCEFTRCDFSAITSDQPVAFRDCVLIDCVLPTFYTSVTTL